MKTEIAAKDNEQDNKILQLQTEKAELEKELKEAQEDFYQNSIRGQASGEYIHVEDSSNCRARIGIGGNSEQETRSGKNLLELMEGTYSNNGITAVVKDGVITLNGTATAISFIGINLLKNLDLTTDNTYRLSAFNANTTGEATGNYCSLRIKQDGTKETTLNKVNSNNAIVGGFSFSFITIRTAQGITYSNFIIKPQLEAGAGTNEWEQGGVSPSPDYSSKVQTVGGNVNLIEETFKGYNLNGNGAFEVSSSFNMQIAKVKANVIYTLNAKTNVLGYYNEKPTLTSTTYNNSRSVLSGDTDTFVATKDGYIAIRTMSAEKVKLVENAEVGEYSKNGQGCVKVTKCNKNLFGKYVTGIWLDTSKNLYLAFSTTVGFIARVKPNTTYTIKKKNKGNRFLLVAGKEPVKIGNAYSRVIFASNHDLTQYTFTTKENEYYIFLGVYNGTDENELALAVEETQLEYGNKATTYEIHQEQSYIMPTQAEMLEGDYFDWDNEKEVHTWNKLVLNGTETFNSWTGKAPSGYSIFFSKILTNTINSQGDLKCNALKYVENPWESGKNAIGLQRTYKELYISIESKYASTLEQFKTYLKAQYDAGTPVVIYYKLATPTKIAFTEEQKAVAKELNNARTYKNVTNITTDSIAILDLDYAKDLETLITSNQKVEEV